MSYYPDPETLAANPPESWRVVKRGERMWDLRIESGHEWPAETFETRRAATAERNDPASRTRRAVEQERRWMAGETPYGWKSYAECLEDRKRNEAYQAKRRAERAA